jgi:type II secretory pathway pseudopilin PulG
MLVVIAIIALLAGLTFSMLGRATARVKLTKSMSNLRQIYSGILIWSGENGGMFPVNYYSSAEAASLGVEFSQDLIWYESCGKYLYPDRYRRNRLERRLPWTFTEAGYDGTVYLSPNAVAETGYNPKGCASYGYNIKFSQSNKPYTFSLRYDPKTTILLADNSGRTHTLAPGTEAQRMNARNGATAPNKNDGVAAVMFLDGHLETFTAARVKEVNDNPNDPAWGVER